MADAHRASVKRTIHGRLYIESLHGAEQIPLRDIYVIQGHGNTLRFTCYDYESTDQYVRMVILSETVSMRRAFRDATRILRQFTSDVCDTTDMDRQVLKSHNRETPFAVVVDSEHIDVVELVEDARVEMRWRIPATERRGATAFTVTIDNIEPVDAHRLCRGACLWLSRDENVIIDDTESSSGSSSSNDGDGHDQQEATGSDDGK